MVDSETIVIASIALMVLAVLSFLIIVSGNKPHEGDRMPQEFATKSCGEKNMTYFSTGFRTYECVTQDGEVHNYVRT